MSGQIFLITAKIRTPSRPIRYGMSQDIDHLKAFEKASRENLSSNHIDLIGLDELRAHQRGENVGKPAGRRRGRASCEVSPELIIAVRQSRCTQLEIAYKFGISQATVSKILNGGYDK